MERPYALGRRVEHDPRSRAFDVETLVAHVSIRGVEWTRYSPILDQGQLGSCTGNAMVGWLGCAPPATGPTSGQWDETLAVALYGAATKLDKWPGNTYPPTDEGSSGLAVAKAAKRAGLISSYSWAFTTAGLLRALQKGPVLLGTAWTRDMFQPDADGFVTPTGPVEGGHEYLCRGYRPDGGGYLICDNSWGNWGPLNGSFKVRLADWETLRTQQADVTVPHV